MFLQPNPDLTPACPSSLPPALHSPPLTDLALATLRTRAQTLLATACTTFEEHKRRTRDSSDSKMLHKFLHSGTLSDKVSALTLMVQESPLHRLSTLEQLLAMARKKGKREQTLAVTALKDLFLSVCE